MNRKRYFRREIFCNNNLTTSLPCWSTFAEARVQPWSCMLELHQDFCYGIIISHFLVSNIFEHTRNLKAEAWVFYQEESKHWDLRGVSESNNVYPLLKFTPCHFIDFYPTWKCITSFHCPSYTFNYNHNWLSFNKIRLLMPKTIADQVRYGSTSTESQIVKSKSLLKHKSIGG